MTIVYIHLMDSFRLRWPAQRLQDDKDAVNGNEGETIAKHQFVPFQPAMLSARDNNLQCKRIPWGVKFIQEDW